MSGPVLGAPVVVGVDRTRRAVTALLDEMSAWSEEAAARPVAR